jgi:prepilin-type N-terminal cleavage/methylation domain-containing protein
MNGVGAFFQVSDVNLEKRPHLHYLGDGYICKLSIMNMIPQFLTVYPPKLKREAQGFTLLEVMVSLIILLAIVGGVMPVFLSYHLSTINNDIKTGAIALSQQILDELRQEKNVDAWATTGTVTTTPGGTAIGSMSHSGKTYNAQITYCANTTFCNDTTRQVVLEIRHNNRTIYTVETIYTKLD